MGYPWPLNTQRVPNFRPFRSISYHFRDIVNFLFRRSRDLGNKKWPKMGSLSTEHPAGPKFSSVIALCLPVFEISPTSCFEGHMTSEIKNGYLENWTPSRSQIFVSFVLSLTVFGYRQLPVSRVMWPQKLKMAENGLAWQFSTQWVPNFRPFRSNLLPFSRYRQLPVSKVTWTRKFKMAENGFPCPLNTQRVPNFCPFRSISYRFRDIANFLFRRSRDLGN